MFAFIFGISQIFNWNYCYQYLKVCVAIPSIFTAISIDNYLKMDNKQDATSKSMLSKHKDTTGHFDFQSYMQALKEHKKR